MKKVLLILLAVVFIGSGPVLACGGGSCPDPDPEPCPSGACNNSATATGIGIGVGVSNSESDAEAQAQATGGSVELSGQFGGAGGKGGAGGAGGKAISSASADNQLKNVGNSSVRIEDEREFLPVPVPIPLPVIEVPKYDRGEDLTNYEFIPFVLMSYGGSLEEGLLVDKAMAEAMVEGDSDSFWVGTDNYDMDGKFLDRTGDRYESVRVQYIPGIDLLRQVKISNYGKPKGAVEISAEPGEEVTTKYLLGNIVLEALSSGVTNLIIYEDGSRTENWERANGLGIPGGASTISGSTGIAGGGVIGHRSNVAGFHRDITIRALGLEGNVQKNIPSPIWTEGEER